MNLKILVPSYALGVNLGTIGLFYYDKEQAKNKGWRVSEQTLFNTALFGGWYFLKINKDGRISSNENISS
jgi:uncharacterized membrane protein YsdA (DUF1294 family)